MTTTPPTPPNAFAFMRLDIYQVCRQLTVQVSRMNIADAELRDQATRAVKSVLLNLAEGLPLEHSAGVRRRYFKNALGSLYELVAAVDVSEALGLITAEQLADALDLAYRARGMLAALVNR